MKNPMQETPRVMQEPSWELSDTQPELEHQGWEEKFDEEFDVFYNDSSWAGKKQVKYYIYVLLENQKREIIEIAEGTKKHKHLDNCNLQEISPEKCGWCLASNLHYNQALQDLITNLTK